MTPRHLVAPLALVASVLAVAYLVTRTPAPSAPDASAPMGLPDSCWPDRSPWPCFLSLHAWTPEGERWRDPVTRRVLDEAAAVELQRQREAVRWRGVR